MKLQHFGEDLSITSKLRSLSTSSSTSTKLVFLNQAHCCINTMYTSRTLFETDRHASFIKIEVIICLRFESRELCL